MSDFQKPVFSDTFAVPISLGKLFTKSLHVTVVSMTGQKEEIIVSYQQIAGVNCIYMKIFRSIAGYRAD